MFIIANNVGKQLATAEHFEIAMAILRHLPFAVRILRQSNGEVLAFKPTPVLTSKKRGRA